MIYHQVPFLNLAFLLPRQLPKHLPKVRSQLPKERLPPIFRDEDDMIFAFPFRVIQTFAYIHFESPLVEPGRFTTAILKNDSRSCQTPGVSPAKPGDFPITLKTSTNLQFSLFSICFFGRNLLWICGLIQHEA
jgi:hypothetical protein